MRVELPGVSRSEQSFRFRFDGRDIEAFPGETIAAALLNADIWSLRRTRGGQGRGLFCGMGVCGECSVLVDGVQRRACLENARAGSDVSTMPALASVQAPPPALEGSCTTTEELTPDVLVVGAGPAGLSAAEAAASSKLDVLVVDERAKAGGQYFKQPGRGFAVNGRSVDPQFAEGAERISRAEAAGARFLFGATVWGAFGPNELVISHGGRTLIAKPRRIILAPGAYERPHLFPGWTLPGVMTTGAAQTLLRSSQTAPGRRVLICGNGPLNLQVARELVAAGADVVSLAELAAPPWHGSATAALALGWNAPRLAFEGVRHLLALRKAHVPVHYRSLIIRAEGEGKVSRAVIARVGPDGAVEAGSQRLFEIDSVCLGYGFLPQNEIARALGCEHRVAPDGSLVTTRDEDGRTSLENVFVAGDAGGLGGARVAIAQGWLAGGAAAVDLGGRKASKAHVEARRLLERHRRFQKALWGLYAPAGVPATRVDADTLLCRCEEVGGDVLNEVLDQGVQRLGAVKRASRLGMGRCQGRYCGPAVAALLASRAGRPMAADEFFAPRSPFKPVTICAAATAATCEH